MSLYDRIFLGETDRPTFHVDRGWPAPKPSGVGNKPPKKPGATATASPAPEPGEWPPKLIFQRPKTGPHSKERLQDALDAFLEAQARATRPFLPPADPVPEEERTHAYVNAITQHFKTRNTAFKKATQANRPIGQRFSRSSGSMTPPKEPT